MCTIADDCARVAESGLKAPFEPPFGLSKLSPQPFANLFRDLHATTLGEKKHLLDNKMEKIQHI